MNSFQANIFLLSGPVEAGKTAYLEKLAVLVEAAGIGPCGFLCNGIFIEGEKMGFKLLNLQTGREQFFAGKKEFLEGKEQEVGWINYGRYYFDPEGFKQGEQWIENMLRYPMNKVRGLIIIDEVGPLELDAKGWSTSLDKLVHLEHGIQLWSVREKSLPAVMKKWKIRDDRVIYMNRESPEQSAGKLIELYRSINIQKTGGL